jgi:hypothetical protein
MSEERTDKMSVLACIAHRGAHDLAKFLDIIRDEVGQVTVLGVIPDHLDRVQIRGVAGKPLYLKPVYFGLSQEPNGLAVGTVAIHHHDELAAQVAVQQVEKGHNLLGGDVVVVHLEVQAQALPQGRHRDPSDDRETVMPIPAVVDRCLASRRPSTTHHRLEHEAALIDQHDAPAFATGLFLIRDQSRSRHRVMASSSLSRARRSGFWQLQPISRRMYHT